MIEWSLPEPLLWALRWALLLGPIALALWAARRRPPGRRAQIGALFAFLYGLGVIFVTHQIALWLGWWRYGWKAQMLEGMPADLLLGGAILFGPTLYLLFPTARPLWLCLPVVILLHGAFFSSLAPLVAAGPGWFAGVLFVFATAHLPALHLAQWTEADVHLPRRVALLAVMFGANAFVLLPSLIMAAMGGEWGLESRPLWTWALAIPAFGVACLIGVAAAQMLALEGLGTAIPLDPTKRLVRTGVYAYVCNPMQLSAALGWLILGAFLQNVWVALAALMAWVFVLGLVRWHHRHDLLKRFPTGWPEYRRNVPEWLPRWRPWVKAEAELRLDARDQRHRAYAKLASRATGLRVSFEGSGPARYRNPLEIRGYEGAAALAMALTHVNVVFALCGHALLLVVLASDYLLSRRRAAMAP